MSSTSPVNNDGTGDRKILVATDFGTTFAATSYCIVKDGIRISDPVRIEFNGGRENQTPVIFAKSHSTSEWLWGHKVTSKLKSHNLECSEVIRYLKLSLSDAPSAQDLRDRIRKQLEELGTDPEKLIEYYFRQMHDLLKEKLRDSYQDVQQLPQEWVISVPQMWGPIQTRKMMAAAQNAGLPQCSLVSEPQCVVAAHFLKSEAITGTLLVADVGGGTADFASFYREVDPAQPNKVNLVMLGAEGSLGGSIWINEAFKKHLESREYGKAKVRMGELADEFGISEDNFLAQADKDFEDAKREMTAEDDNTRFCITIFSSEEANGEKCKKFYLTCLRKAGKEVETIIFSGGLSQNPLLMKSLRARFVDKEQQFDRNGDERKRFNWDIRFADPLNVQSSMSAVSDGALYLKCFKGDFDIVQPFFQYSIGVAQDEEPCTSVKGHEDVTKMIKKPGVKRKVRVLDVNNRKIQRSYRDGEDIILDRIRWLVKKGDERKPNFTAQFSGELYFDVNDTEHKIEQKLYFTSNEKLLDHCSIYDHKDEIREFCTITRTITNAESHRWPKVKDVYGRDLWEVPYSIEISGDPMNLKFRVILHERDEAECDTGDISRNKDIEYEEPVETNTHSFLTDGVPPSRHMGQRKRRKRRHNA